MEFTKQLLSVKIIKMSEYLGLSKKDIGIIIRDYIRFKQIEVMTREIRIGDLIEIVPNPIYDSSITSLAYTATLISNKRAYPYHSVYAVLSTYLGVQKEQLSMGRPVDFRGIVKIHPIVVDGVIKSIRSSVSAVLTELVSYESTVNSVRVHTAKKLKQEIIGKHVGHVEIIEDDLMEEGG